MNIYHYTSKKNFENIKKDKKLLPLSDPFAGDYFASKTSEKLASHEIKALIQHRNYIVGIPAHAIENWNDSGLLENIIELTTGEIQLQFPLTYDEGIFLREARYLTAAYMEQSGGRNLWIDLRTGRMSPSQFVCRKYHRRYIESTTLLENYDGEFELPEIWLPQPVPFDQITI